MLISETALVRVVRRLLRLRGGKEPTGESCGGCLIVKYRSTCYTTVVTDGASVHEADTDLRVAAFSTAVYKEADLLTHATPAFHISDFELTNQLSCGSV